MDRRTVSELFRAASAAVICVLALTVVPVTALDVENVAEVRIVAMKFEPAHIKVKVGTTVRWTNGEKRNNHSIRFSEDDESERLFPGESWQRRFERVGKYPYVCGPHPEMQGEVEVVE